jgi:hypothetical protein
MIATWRAEGGLGIVADYFAQGFDQMNDGECWGMGGNDRYFAGVKSFHV